MALLYLPSCSIAMIPIAIKAITHMPGIQQEFNRSFNEFLQQIFISVGPREIPSAIGKFPRPKGIHFSDILKTRGKFWGSAREITENFPCGYFVFLFLFYFPIFHFISPFLFFVLQLFENTSFLTRDPREFPLGRGNFPRAGGISLEPRELPSARKKSLKTRFCNPREITHFFPLIFSSKQQKNHFLAFISCVTKTFLMTLKIDFGMELKGIKIIKIMLTDFL